ncbi:hypothetical protein [uncultured Corynebacterium sp.]|uniref:hypothetical protein n=1 Tax=uncultured Corynebacterium sp. TaxID=159447 RepID=UPI0025F547C5|nr:hypothetical protein [uncultured Corynebacterium sp.]
MSPVPGQRGPDGSLVDVKKRCLAPLFLAAGMVLTACGSDSGPETAPVPLEVPKVTLVDAGEGDAEVVEWTDDGAEQDTSIVVTQGFTQRAEGAGVDGSADSTTPDTRLEMPVEVRASGSGEERSAEAEVGVPFGSNAELNDDIATAEGFVAKWRGDATGRMLELELGAPEEATDTARAGTEAALMQWARLPIVFPTEPIAPGARWTVDAHAGGDSSMRQTLTYTLESRSGDDVELDVEVSQTPAVTELDAGDGLALQVVDSDTETRTGELTIDLGAPLPTAGLIDYVTSVTYGDGDSDGSIVQRTHRAVQFGK